MPKKQVCFTTDEDTYKELKEVREKTGIPISKQIDLQLKGYKIIKAEKKESE
jgi:hypothetical protein